jgi:hypothetical protein
MRTASWAASALLALAACGGARDGAHEGARETARVASAPSTVEGAAAGDSTRLRIRTGAGATYELTVARDTTVPPGAPPTRIEVVGELPGAAVVVDDTYPSAPLGMSFCQAGEERFLRVVATRDGRATETMRLKLASCRENLELATPGLEWLPDSSAVRVHWLLGPGGAGAPSVRTIRIGPDGRPLSAAARPGATATRRAAPA